MVDFLDSQVLPVVQSTGILFLIQFCVEISLKEGRAIWVDGMALWQQLES